jgi:hypothetical protein
VKLTYSCVTSFYRLLWNSSWPWSWLQQGTLSHIRCVGTCGHRSHGCTRKCCCKWNLWVKYWSWVSATNSKLLSVSTVIFKHNRMALLLPCKGGYKIKPLNTYNNIFCLMISKNHSNNIPLNKLSRVFHLFLLHFHKKEKSSYHIPLHTSKKRTLVK